MSKTIEEKARQTLCELAFGKVSDAVSLLYLTDEEVLSKLPRMKLMNISEIKRPKGGGMEIKFFDRIKACERLLENDGAQKNSGLSFYQALEKSAESIARAGDGNG